MRILFAALVSASASSVLAQSLANPGFETSDPLDDLPVALGVWGGDVNNRANAEQGITPLEGSFMLEFFRTATQQGGGGVAGGGKGGDLWQLVDLAPVIADVQAGGLYVWHAVSFNRIAGDAQTDTRFTINARGYSGSPAGFKTGPNSVATPLAERGNALESDGDTGTWERLRVKLLIPTDATYLAVSASAVENVFNDVSGIEFDGHYADAASILFTRCEGDLDGDGDTDVFDFAILASAFGTAPPAAGWDQNADIVVDDVIDVFDFAALASDFGCGP